VIVGAVRTPVGRRGGALQQWHPVDLLGHTLRTLVDRTGVDASLVDDVIAGCVLQNEEQGGNLGRHAVLAAGLPESVPAVTVDRQCGSGQQAVSFAAQAIMADCADLVIACGVESMSRVPMPPAMTPGAPLGPQYSPRELSRYPAGSERGELMAQGASSELMNSRFGLSRAELDEFSARSHERAWAATQAGRFAGQLVPLTVDPADPRVRPDQRRRGHPAEPRPRQDGHPANGFRPSRIGPSRIGPSRICPSRADHGCQLVADLGRRGGTADRRPRVRRAARTDAAGPVPRAVGGRGGPDHPIHRHPRRHREGLEAHGFGRR
jgi:hypothetical protein